jgi:hypothetical protein
MRRPRPWRARQQSPRSAPDDGEAQSRAGQGASADPAYLDDAIAQLRATGHKITDEDLRRLSPLQQSTSRCSATSPSPCPTTSPPARGDSYANSARPLSVRFCSITTGRPIRPRGRSVRYGCGYLPQRRFSVTTLSSSTPAAYRPVPARLPFRGNRRHEQSALLVCAYWRYVTDDAAYASTRVTLLVCAYSR